METDKRIRIHDDDGFMLIGILIIIALSLMVTVGMVGARASEGKIHASMNDQSKNYYRVEETMSKTLGWLRANSKNLVYPFLAANFNSNFDVGVPATAANDGLHFSVPTMVKMKGTNNSVMLSNNAFFGISAFPSTEHLDTATSFDAVAEFEAADLGEANVRVVLTWARETDGDFEPIFRVDAVNGNNPDRGVHSFSYVQTNFQASSGPIFFASNDITLSTGNNKCYSHKYAFNGAGSWDKGAQRSNCTMAAGADIRTKAKINGSVYTPGSVTLVNPSGDISGAICEGSVACDVLAIPSLDSWGVTCGGANQGDLVIASDTTLSVASNAPADKCWRDIIIKSNVTVTLDTTDYPYHFRKITFQNNSNSQLKFADLADTDKISIFFERIDGDSINGNHLFNTNNAPHQVEWNMTGNYTLRFNGTAQINVSLIAPYSNIEMLGNFNFYGGIKAANISTTGNVRMNGDEKLAGAAVISDIAFSKKKASQRYRLF